MAITEVVEKANKSITELFKVIDDMAPQDLAASKTIGNWSVKDVLNHLTIWEEEAAKAFEIWKVGIEPDWSHISDLDKFNDTTVKERRKNNLTKIKSQLQLIHNGVIENIKSVSDEEYAKRGGAPKWLANLITDHVAEHTARIIEYKKTLEHARQKSA
jgi:hypothetical protein